MCIQTHFSYSRAIHTIGVWLGICPGEVTEVKTALFLLEEQRRKGLIARETGQTVDIKPKNSTNMCLSENSTGRTNGGLEELVEKEIAENILILFNHLTSAMFVKPSTERKMFICWRRELIERTLLLR